MTSTDVDYVLASLLTKSKNAHRFSPVFNDITPEVVVIFVEPELSTDQITKISSRGSMTHLKESFEGAESTLTIPYTTSDLTLLDQALPKVFDNIEGSIFLARLSGSELFTQFNSRHDVKLVEVDSLLAELKAVNAFRNGMTDVVIVCFDKPAYHSEYSLIAHDEHIGTISEEIRTASKGNFVAIFTANSPTPSSIQWSFDEYYELEQIHMRAFFDEDNVTNNTNKTNTTSHHHKVNYFPGPLLEVYIISAILLTMLFTGGCAIFSLQTPDRWEAPKVKKDLF